jgi:hypothetical protein
MEVMVAVQIGTLLRALRVQLKRRVSARSRGDYNDFFELQKTPVPVFASPGVPCLKPCLKQADPYHSQDERKC